MRSVLIVIAVLTMALPSCQALRERAQEAPVQMSLAEFEEVLDSRVVEVVGSAVGGLRPEIQQAVDAARLAVDEAKQARIDAGKPLEDPITWQEWVLGGLATAFFGGGGGALGLNFYRNRLREARGEPVKSTATVPHSPLTESNASG